MTRNKKNVAQSVHQRLLNKARNTKRPFNELLQGYKVTFTPFEDGAPADDYETFADGFAGVEPIPNRSAAEHRPMGLAMGPNGALYISDSQKGRIWRVVYTGNSE